MRSRVTTGILALALLAAAPAPAATVSYVFNRADPGDGRTIRPTDHYDFRFEAAPGEANRVTIKQTLGAIRVRDDGAALTAGPNCVPDGAEVVCSAGPMLGSNVLLGDGNDTLTLDPFFATVDDGPGDDRVVANDVRVHVLAAPGADLMRGRTESTVDYRARTEGVRVTPDGVADDGAPGEGDDVGPGFTFVYGGAGDDELHGGDHAPQGWVEGGAGDDRIIGGESFNKLIGGDGDDELHGNIHFDQLDPGPGADLVRGGPGHDTFFYAGETRPVRVTLDDARGDGPEGENDDIGSDVEVVSGGSGNDVVIGSDKPEQLGGGPAGYDLIDGRGGADSIGAQNGRLIGGAGSDTVRLGGSGELDLHDGERDVVECGAAVRLLSVDPFDSLTACAPQLHGPPLGKRLRARRDGVLLVRFQCPRAADIPCSGRIRANVAQESVARVVGRGRVLLAPGARRLVRIRLTTALRKRLARAGKLQLMIVTLLARESPASRRVRGFEVTVLRPRR